jgi:hypothetical protein
VKLENEEKDTNNLVSITSDDNPFYCITCDEFVQIEHFPHRNVSKLSPELQILVDDSSNNVGWIF